MEEKEKKTVDKKELIKTIVGISLCVIFGFILVCNLTIVVQGMTQPNRPPSIFGVTPVVVVSESMSSTEPDHIEKYDLIFVSPVDYSQLKELDIITFIESKTANGLSLTTHRIVGKDEKGFITKGDSSESLTQDPWRVTEENLIGKVSGRIPLIGAFILFLKEWYGMLVFIGVPIAAFIAWDIYERKKYEKALAAKKDDKTAALEAEIERLRAAAAANAVPASDETPKPDGE